MNTLNVWRVDDELLTCVEAEVFDDAPINHWLYAAFGSGMYIYLLSESDAKDTFRKMIAGKIGYLQGLLNNFELGIN